MIMGNESNTNGSATTNEASESIDESLYSRQLYVMGHEAQRKMGSSKVLIVGLNGLGAEVAKNVILAGVKEVTLVDKTPTSYMDLSSQFYLTESDLGKPRASCCLPKLSELNPYVEVSVYDGSLCESFISMFTVVVMTNTIYSEVKRVNDICHNKNIAFISSDVRGLFGSIFCDFGDRFVVHDKNGERPVECMVSSITNQSPALVTVSDDSRHQLETGDYVTFREVEGISELNECTPRPIEVTGPYTFTIGDVQGQYVKGGYVTQVKQPVEIEFKSYSTAVTQPGEFMISDFSKLGRSEVLHQAFRGLNQFAETHGEFPEPGNLDHSREVVKLTKELNDEAVSNGEFSAADIESYEKIIIQLAIGSRGLISPMTAFFGGVVGQETLKACSGKFTPIKQFFYFDSAECLPDEILPTDQYTPINSRYDSQIAVFGRDFQENIKNKKLFLVGAGAIGCEMLKNWALMGIASGNDGLVHVTDMDVIERSNLNRQFLFRSKDVQKAKSTIAGKAVCEMNPEMKVTSHVLRVGTETENVFDDDFFESLDGVCTALDNVDARMYMDQKCLFYQLPMFESGTLGTKGNTQIVVPCLTENYGASRDPPEKSIPICTLKNFPNAIEHTLQWARDWFEGDFTQIPGDVNQYLSNSNFLSTLDSQPNTKIETLEKLKASLVDHKPLTFDECIIWARLKFEYMYNNQIRQLLHNFPLDQVTSSGAPFWSGPKRPPTPITFDVHDPLHLDFVVSVANCRAENYGLMGRRDRNYFINILSSMMVPEFTPREGVKIAANDTDINKDNSNVLEDLDSVASDIISCLPTPSSLAGYRMIPIEFDKDNDNHMEVIVAVSNLRARNYKIQEADMHKSRFIAGKIIPAIATTTALVTGLVCLEMYKVFLNKTMEAYKNGFINLALPLFAFSEPIEPKFTKSQLKGEEYKFSAWDRLDMNVGDMTLKDFLSYFETKYELEISMISYGVTMLYAMFSNKQKIQERMKMKMTELVANVTNKKIHPKQKFLIFELCANDMEGEEVDLPYVRYRFRP